MTAEIKGMVNQKAWDEWIENNQDPYGGACVKIARRVMEYLDEHDVEFNLGYHPDMTTPHGIICYCDTDEGITGFMASAVKQMVTVCYEDGWKFWLADSIMPIGDLDKNAEGTVEKVYKAIDEGHVTADKDEVRQYAADLVKRYRESQPDEQE